MSDPRVPYATAVDLAAVDPRIAAVVRAVPSIQVDAALVAASDFVDAYLAPFFHIPLQVPLPAGANEVKRSVCVIAARELAYDPSGWLDEEYVSVMAFLDGLGAAGARR